MRRGLSGRDPTAPRPFVSSGDGLTGLGEFGAGNFLGAIPFTGQPIVTLDVTSFVQALVAGSQNFAGFDLRIAPHHDRSE